MIPETSENSLFLTHQFDHAKIHNDHFFNDEGHNSSHKLEHEMVHSVYGHSRAYCLQNIPISRKSLMVDQNRLLLIQQLYNRKHSQNYTCY